MKKTFFYLTAIIIISTFLFIFTPVYPESKEKNQTIEDKTMKSNIYYIDSNEGEDTHDGKSKKTPWKTLSKVNSITFSPGDKILFKAGTKYFGQLKPNGSGKLIKGKPYPIIIDIYGKGDKPCIDAQGEFESALYLFNVEYWEVNNLEIMNKGKKRKPRRKGVFIHIKDYGTAHHIQLKNLYVHDVNGSLTKKNGGGTGIEWLNHSPAKKSRFDGILIEGCVLRRCERNGILGAGNWKRNNWYPTLNVVIRSNLLEEVPGDGLLIGSCDGALVEYNVMRKCTRLLPDGDAAAGIWPWSSDNTIIQFNEVSDHKAPWDAQGFDSDWNCRNTIIQYNYSHDNEGGFLLICNNGNQKMPENIGTHGTIVRYNISINDGLRATGEHAGFSPTFHISGPVKDTRIYNNVIIIPQKPAKRIDKTIIKMDNWGGPWPENTYFANNIFYVEDKARYIWGKSQNHIFENNLFFGTHRRAPEDNYSIQTAPMFASSSNKKAMPGFKSLKKFMLKKGSPCIKAGKLIKDNGGIDFWGNSLPTNSPPCIGIHEFKP